MHELAINVTDICIGDFWVTAERRAYMAPQATFAAPVADAKFFFITRLGKVAEGWSW